MLAAVATTEHHTSATSTLRFVRIVRPVRRSEDVMHGLPSARWFHFGDVTQIGVFQVLSHVLFPRLVFFMMFA